MSKNMMSKRRKELEDEIDFSQMDLEDNECMAGMMSGFIEASHHQMILAVELTKLVASKNSAESMTEEKIFSVFKQASKVISESSPLKVLWEKFS